MEGQQGGRTFAAQSFTKGSVVAAQTNLPIDDAIVSIVVAGGGILPANRASAFWHTSRSTRTDANGVYRFDGLAPGRYQLHIQRIGSNPGAPIRDDTFTTTVARTARCSYAWAFTPAPGGTFTDSGSGSCH